jgi:ATP-dependent DNA helicase RecG
MDVGTRIAIVSRAEELLGEPLTSDDQLRQARQAQKISPKAAPARDEVQKPRAPEREPLVNPSSDGSRLDRAGLAPVPVAATKERSQRETPITTRASAPPSLVSSNVSSKPPHVLKAYSGPKAHSPLRHEGDLQGDSQGDKPHSTSVQFVKGVGPKVASILGHLNIDTVEDLLRHYPRKHLDFQNRLKICELEPGQEVTILGTIRSVSAFQSRRGNLSILNVVIADGTGSINITRFIGGKSNKYLLDRYKEQYPKGCQVIASGIVERDSFGKRFTLKNGEIELLGYANDGDLEEAEDASEPLSSQHNSIHTGRLVPVYPLTEGLSLRHLRTIIYNALTVYGQRLIDALPERMRQKFHLIDLKDAIEAIHFPDNPDQVEQARRRLVFDELFAVQLQMALRRHKFDSSEAALSLKLEPSGLIERLRNSLPFALTGAQERVFKEIASDLAAAKPMHRLVQGDVGSGKTIVALMAALIAIDNGYQAVIMAPTEILAEQHFRQFQRLITPLGLRCAVVLGKQGTKERRHMRQEILSGQIHITVGTHALLEEDVEFANLGLIIIDEQHRFGVKQRARLKAKSQAPELLTMTATPIPRTLALTMHGDLDVSEIDEMPPGRKPIETKLMRPSERKQLFDFIREQVAAGRQAYVVFPLIEESETLAAKAATQEFEKLKEKVFPDLRIGLMHGKLKQTDKDQVMDDFRDRKYDILVCTTVIEVGVDVPNASVMVIENADRFGLAQLHQLRGRVGRGSDQSYCFLATENRSPTARQRLAIMTQTNDGFVIAEKDLEIRGPGEFLGYRQSGLPDLILADLVKDAKTLEEARQAAIELVKLDPELENFPLLKAQPKYFDQVARGEIMHSG